MSASDLVPVVSQEEQGDGERLDRRGVVSRLAVLGGIAGVTGYVFLADPDGHGTYPRCPSRWLLGIDCPACGGLRGTNALLHGRIGEALDHNLLLPGLLGAFALLLGLWLLPLFGRPERQLRLPAWLAVALVGALAAFTVARNLPFSAFDYLASEA